MTTFRRAAFVTLLSFVFTASAYAATASYPVMAPVHQYLMKRDAEIALARSAAPPSISKSATVLVLTAHGYTTAHEGTNGFTCLVERSWMSPFDSSQFWNPKIRGPICYNPPATRSVLLYTLGRTRMALAGVSKAQMLSRIQAEVAHDTVKAPIPGSMSYMLSKHGYLGDGTGAWVPHLMFAAPKADGAKNGASWGADLPGSPIVIDNEHVVMPEPETIFMIPVGHWSDGSPAPTSSS